VPSQESEWSCNRIKYFVSVSTIFRLHLGTVPTLWCFLFFILWILELFQQCGIFFLFHFMDFGTVPTVWCFLFFILWILELFQQCGIFFLFHFMDFGTVPTVCYFFSFSFYGFWNCSNSVIFFVFHFINPVSYSIKTVRTHI
jgi:hypothetical protein